MSTKLPEPYIPSGKRHYHFRFTDSSGTRRTKKTPYIVNEKKLARAFIEDFMRGEADDAPGGVRRVVAFRDYSAPYFQPEGCPHITRLEDEGKSFGERHRRDMLRGLDAVRRDSFADIPIGEITRGAVLDLRKRLYDRLSASTALKALKAAKVVLSEAAFREDITGNPASNVGVKMKKQREGQSAERGAFYADEVAHILTDLHGPMDDAQTRALVALLFGSGMRGGEVRALTWGKVNTATGAVVIDRAMKLQDGPEVGLPKWDKVRSTHLPAFAIEALKGWRAQWLRSWSRKHKGDVPDLSGVPVFPGRSTYYAGQSWISTRFRRVVDAARSCDWFHHDDERQLSAHSCRHTVATVALAMGVNPITVQAGLGWSGGAADVLTKVQAGYSHLSMLDTKDIARALDAAFVLDAEQATGSA